MYINEWIFKDLTDIPKILYVVKIKSVQNRVMKKKKEWYKK